jgi:hypothetical protein
MNRFRLLALFILPLAGCAKDATPDNRTAATQKAAPTSTKTAAKSDEEEIKESLAALSPEDRKLAEAQKYCANATKSRLGSMGTPEKVMVKDTPVFVCCGHCKKGVLEDPDKTLAKVEELKKQAADEATK